MKAKLPAALPHAYQPSILRRFPLLSFDGQRMYAPIRDLINARTTEGLYYDVVAGGPANLRNEASAAFNSYCARYFATTLPGFKLGGDERYRIGKQDFNAPDIHLSDDRQLVAIIECKATKLTFEAQFADDPAVHAKRGLSEIAKGVFQIWRYVSHVRSGMVPDLRLAERTLGVVLTLDSWLVVSRELQNAVIAEAAERAEAEGNILPADRIPTMFCSVTDLESILSYADEASFLAGLSVACEERHLGWHPVDFFRKASGPRQSRQFPFDLGEVVPWWNDMRPLMEERAARRSSAKAHPRRPAGSVVGDDGGEVSG
jgi:hypothetical protein